MAQLVGEILAFASGDTTVVDTTARVTVGTRAKDAAGNEYIYLKGVASVAARSLVTFDENYQATLGAANAVGPVAFAQAAVVADRWGWFLIYGSGSGEFAGAAVADAPLYLAAAGAVDDAVVAGDLIVGAKVAATVAGAGAGAIFVSYPFVTDKLG